MNDRLLQFLNAENLSQSQFADSINVARASVSHIIAGRNKPGFDFIESMAKAYPALNIEWIITGKGKMYKTAPLAAPVQAPGPAPAPVQEPVFQPAEEEIFPVEREPEIPEKPSVQIPEKPVEQPRKAPEKPVQAPRQPRQITKIIVFYDDNTFQELK